MSEERTRLDDLADLANAAIDALATALHDGDGKHAPGSWKNESFANQIDHLYGHIMRLIENAPDDEEDHLTHIICRSVIAYALRHPKIPD